MTDSKRDKSEGNGAFPGFDPKSVEPYIVKDPEAMAVNFARALENLGKAASAWLAPRERGEKIDTVADPITDIVKTLSKVSEYWLSDPRRTLECTNLSAVRLFQPVDENHAAVSAAIRSPRLEAEPIKDKRFADEDWQKNPFFDFLRQTYLLTAGWAEKLVTDAEGLDEHTRRHKAAFYTKQITAALSPANFVATNPQLYRETVASNAENLVRGMKMFAEDMSAGHGELRLRQTDMTKFAVGRGHGADTRQGDRAERRLPDHPV